ncbi:MAG: hypothetical protein A2Y38_03420 [Spirochaetes bacterium GWB1_59_5]|nr:MAG: hypothetical protein A2Y38_03420 [Spirochaetes bacterium GWB1_59_5]
MAVLLRTSQRAVYVHATDSDAVLPADGAAHPGPYSDWLNAAGQPATCTRWEVRPLSPAEMADVLAAQKAGDWDRSQTMLLTGLVSLDGEPFTAERMAAELIGGWPQEVAALIQTISMHGPLAGRRSR